MLKILIHPKTSLWIALLLMIAYLSSQVFSAEVPKSDNQDAIKSHPVPQAHINYISDYQEDQQLFIDAQATLQLSDEMIAAVRHEIPLHFKTQIVLSEKDQFLGIDIFAENQTITYETELRYFGYTKTYILTNKRNKQTRSFLTLKEALYTLSVLYNFPIIELSRLHPSNAYQIKLRLSLMPWKLPAPLILDGYVSRAWQLDTNWHKIEIHTPQTWY